jgi:hypothetical protein
MTTNSLRTGLRAVAFAVGTLAAVSVRMRTDANRSSWGSAGSPWRLEATKRPGRGAFRSS